MSKVLSQSSTLHIVMCFFLCLNRYSRLPIKEGAFCMRNCTPFGVVEDSQEYKLRARLGQWRSLPSTQRGTRRLMSRLTGEFAGESVTRYCFRNSQKARKALGFRTRRQNLISTVATFLCLLRLCPKSALLCRVTGARKAPNISWCI